MIKVINIFGWVFIAIIVLICLMIWAYRSGLLDRIFEGVIG